MFGFVVIITRSRGGRVWTTQLLLKKLFVSGEADSRLRMQLKMSVTMGLERRTRRIPAY